MTMTQLIGTLNTAAMNTAIVMSPTPAFMSSTGTSIHV